MTFAGRPSVGIVYKTYDTSKTYTHWHHYHIDNHTSPNTWLLERIHFDLELRRNKINTDRIMLIVRCK